MHLEPTEAWCLLRICAVLVVFLLFAAHLIKLKKNVPLFYCWLGAIAVLGGAAAFFLPIAVNSGFAKEDDGAALRQAILYTTGGLLGVITLGETHRKNNQEKEKNENDHTRQVYAERRSRYTTAVEQLANEKAPVRLGGIYTLVGLVDEWLADDSLKPEERKKEGQVIINNLCSYIRSPFPLAEKREVLEKDHVPDDYNDDFTADQAQLRGEQDVRRAIFEEMRKRSSTFTKDKKGDVFKTAPGIWSDFDFDFNRAPIFYPLNNLTIEKGNFSSAKFYSVANFSEAIFSEAKFSEAKFTGNAHFLGTEFTGAADFGGAEFTGNAHFRNAKFTRGAGFKNVKFTRYTDFRKAKFTRGADFRNAEFTGYAGFSKAEFTENADFRNAEFAGNAHFWNAKFTRGAGFSKAKFTGNADFGGAEFTGAGYFGGVKFTGNADFGGTEFTEKAHFKGAEFTRIADFGDAKFTGITYFGGAKFTRSTSFSGAYFEKSAPIFADTSGPARFSAQVAQKDYVFSPVKPGSKSIARGTATLDGKSLKIPLGAVLFNPSSGKTSKPAQ